jgi:hypothetical protein
MTCLGSKTSVPAFDNFNLDPETCERLSGHETSWAGANDENISVGIWVVRHSRGGEVLGVRAGV